MSNALYSIFAFIVVVGILVIIHELGHYLAAIFFRVKVLRFSIGFGPIITKFTAGKDQTEWAISAIPLGGYVRMLDDTDEKTAAEENRTYSSIHPAKRMVISAAGPAMNFLLAIAIGWFLAISGTTEILPIIDNPPPNTPAAQAGLRAGDKIVSMNGNRTHTWQDLSLQAISALLSQQNIEMLIDRQDTHQNHLQLRLIDFEGVTYAHDETNLMNVVGLRLQKPVIDPIIDSVSEDGPAQKAGILTGDRIIRFDDKAITNWLDLVEMVRQRPNQAVDIIIERNGESLPVRLILGSQVIDGKIIGQIGLSAAINDPKNVPIGIVHFGVIDGLDYALVQVKNNIGVSLRFFGSMLSGKISSANLSGPIAIADYAGQSAQMGLDNFLKFLALVSVGLGIINLLPIPMLDGGHLLYHCLELIRKKPLSPNQMAIGQAIGFAFVILLMVLVLYNDFNRYFLG